jgi:hypothetical protein
MFKIKEITAIIANAPIVCEANVIKTIPKIYATADEETIELDDYVRLLENKNYNFEAELARQLKNYYIIFLDLREELEKQNAIIESIGGKPLKLTKYDYIRDEKLLYRAPRQSLVQC